VSSASDIVDVDAAKSAIAALEDGRFVALADSRSPESEASLAIAAEHADAGAVQFMSTHGFGLIRLCLTDERCEELGLASLVRDAEKWQPTGSISLRGTQGSGASAADRAATIRAAADPAYGRDDFVEPGYVFPLRARVGGTLRRAARTEAAVDLARLAGCAPAAAISLFMNEEASEATGDDLLRLCAEHDLPLVTVADVIAYRRQSEKLVQRVADVRLPTPQGDFRAVAFRETITGVPHIALVTGELEGATDVLVRVHARCLAGDIFHSTECRCSAELEQSLRRITSEGLGVLVYLAGTSAGEPLSRHDAEADAVRPMDEYGIGAQILADLGLTTIRILTNTPKTIPALEGFGLQIVDQLPVGGSDV
jgi:3,4-dihydroxy 2-butanone 4-phosphate synthase/GTP cyclohydrolase II